MGCRALGGCRVRWDSRYGGMQNVGYRTWRDAGCNGMRWAERCPSRSTPATPVLGRSCVTQGPVLTALSPERCSADRAVSIPTVRGGAAAVQPSLYVFPPLMCSQDEGSPTCCPHMLSPLLLLLFHRNPKCFFTETPDCSSRFDLSPFLTT